MMMYPPHTPCTDLFRLDYLSIHTLLSVAYWSISSLLAEELDTMVDCRQQRQFVQYQLYWYGIGCISTVSVTLVGF